MGMSQLPSSEGKEDQRSAQTIPAALDAEAEKRRAEFFRRNKEARDKLNATTKKEKAKHAKLRTQVGGLVDTWRHEHTQMLEEEEASSPVSAGNESAPNDKS